MIPAGTHLVRQGDKVSLPLIFNLALNLYNSLCECRNTLWKEAWVIFPSVFSISSNPVWKSITFCGSRFLGIWWQFFLTFSTLFTGFELVFLGKRHTWSLSDTGKQWREKGNSTQCYKQNSLTKVLSAQLNMFIVNSKETRTTPIDDGLLSLLMTLNLFGTWT